MTWMYYVGRGLARFCFSVFGRMEVTGQESVPPYGPLIVVANHISFNDPPVLVSSMPRPLDTLGKRELFANPISRFFMRQLRVHPLDRSRSGFYSIREALRLLAQDRAVGIFPEGRRSQDFSMKKALPGAAYLALKSQAPILPVGIYGTEKFPSWRMAFPLCRFRANIGQPFTLPIVEGTPSREVLESMQDMIMQRIALLIPPEYRGVYAIPSAGGPTVGAAAGEGTGGAGYRTPSP